MKQDQIVIYQTEVGQTQIDVRLENETVWLTQAQMAELFQKDQSVIARHINNAFKEGELEEEGNMHFLHNTQYKYRPTKIYSLDMIISVGYRVKSKRGTAFRIWARKVLKEYLVKGYAVNQRIHREQIGELRQLVGVLGRTIQKQPLISTDETNALFEVVTDYTYALDTLDNYDYERLTIEKTTKEEPFHATYENAMEAIKGLREKFGSSSLFGNEKDESFKSSIGQIYQTFGAEELYPRRGEEGFQPGVVGVEVLYVVDSLHRALPALDLHQPVAVALRELAVRGLAVRAERGLGGHVASKDGLDGGSRALAQLGHPADGLALAVDGTRQADQLVRQPAPMVAAATLPRLATASAAVERLPVALV